MKYAKNQFFLFAFSLLAFFLLSTGARAESACTKCYTAAQVKVVACQRKIKPLSKKPTKEDKATRANAHAKCNKLDIELNNQCKLKCNIK